MNLFVIVGLDVAAAEKAKDTGADAQIVAVVQERCRLRLVVDKYAVRAVEVHNARSVADPDDFRVLARDRGMGEANLTVGVPAHKDSFLAEQIALAQFRSRG